MRVKIVGGFGGLAPGKKCTSILVDDVLLFDLGSASVGMSLEEKRKVKHVFLSHTHLDHIKELPHLCKDFDEEGLGPMNLYTNAFTEASLRNHVFNDIIFTDYCNKPKDSPILKINRIKKNQKVKIEDYIVIPVSVNHPCDAYGFIVKRAGKMILLTLDTGSCQGLWEILEEQEEKLEAIFIDVSFPNFLEGVAEVSGHHTPETLGVELNHMPKDVPIYATHVKPNYIENVRKELDTLGNKDLHIIDKDGMVLSF